MAFEIKLFEANSGPISSKGTKIAHGTFVF